MALLITLHDPDTGAEQVMVANERTFASGSIGYFGTADGLVLNNRGYKVQVQLLDKALIPDPETRAANVAADRAAKAKAKAELAKANAS